MSKNMKQFPIKKRSFFEKLFYPVYDELTLYSMSFVCLLLFLVNNPPQDWNLRSISIKHDAFPVIILFLLFITGIFLCIYHAFTKRNKTLIEKKIMILFAGILSGFSGIWGGTYILEHYSGLFTIFPIWNIISGFILLGGLRGGRVSEDNISDEHAELRQVIQSTIIVSLVFYCCYVLLKMNWAETFSICIAWVTTVNGPINTFISKEKIKLTPA